VGVIPLPSWKGLFVDNEVVELKALEAYQAIKPTPSKTAGFFRTRKASRQLIFIFVFVLV
jgi:hypothetical protein